MKPSPLRCPAVQQDNTIDKKHEKNDRDIIGQITHVQHPSLYGCEVGHETET
jgi:hypothetical protein